MPQVRFRPCLGDGHGLLCYCRRQSLLAVGGHVSVSRDISWCDPNGATLSLAISLHCGVTVTITGLRAHVTLFGEIESLSMSSPLLKRNRPCHNPRAAAPAHVRHVSTQLSPDSWRANETAMATGLQSNSIFKKIVMPLSTSAVLASLRVVLRTCFCHKLLMHRLHLVQ